MIFVFREPVEIAPRKAILVLKCHNGYSISYNHRCVHIYREDGSEIVVPFESIRYWRTNDDDQNRTAESEVR